MNTFTRTCIFAAITALPIVWPGIQVARGIGGWSISGFEYLLGPILLIVLIGVTRLTCRIGRFVARRPPMLIRSSEAEIVLGCLIGFMGGIYASEKLRMYGFELAVDRAQTLTEAMKTYIEETGEVPESVSVLIPDYLPQMPANLPPIEIITEPRELSNFGVDQWALQAEVSSGLLKRSLLNLFEGNTLYVKGPFKVTIYLDAPA